MPVKKTLAVKSPKVRAKFVSEEIPADQIDAEAPSIKSSNALPEPEDITLTEREEDKDFWKDGDAKGASLAEATPEEVEEDSEPQELGFLAQNGKSPNTPLSKLLWIVLAVALFVGGIGGGVLIFKQGVEAGKKEASLVTPTPLPEDTQTPTPEPTTELVRGSLAVEVLNGAGIPGTAKKAETFLAGLGYKIENTANAKSFDYDKTVVSIKESKKEYSQMIIEDLSKEYEVDQTPKVVDEDSEFDVIIVIGKK